MFMSPHTTVASGPAATTSLSAESQRELVLVVIRVRLAAVRHVDGVHADAVARRGHGACLGVREAGRACEPGRHVVQAHPRQDRDPVPRRLAVGGDLVPAGRERIAEQLGERIVGELGLLEADDVRLPLVQPRQEPGHALLQGVDVPGRDAHRLHRTGGRTPGCLIRPVAAWAGRSAESARRR